jgi:pyridinium-3,5-biscarboxylic acid mononucleotide synthase
VSPDDVLRLLESVAAGELAPAGALDRLSLPHIEELAGPDGTFARIDHHRLTRQGFPEVVYCPGKQTDQVLAVCDAIAARGSGFLATRASDDVRAALRRAYPAAEVSDLGRIVHLAGAPRDGLQVGGQVLVVTAGTADMPVAEEAAVTAAAMGNPVERLYDVGVAGIHRVLSRAELLRGAAVVIVVAGMEAALASVVGGLVARPVIAVPTSVGYGASFGGLAALLGLLNSCAAGVTVVNIDNGFGAAVAATRINVRVAT